MPEGASPKGEELVEGAYWAKIGEDGVLTEETAWNLEQELIDGWVRVSPGDAPPYFWNRDTAERLHDFREQAGDSWERVVPADGRVYYWQTETGHRQWNDPAVAQFTMLEEEAGGGWLRVFQEHDAEEHGDETDGAEPKRSSCYYHHPDTGHSVWAEGEGEDDAYVPAILDGDDDAATVEDDDDDVWDDEGGVDPEALAAAEALEAEMARKRREFLKYCSGGDRTSNGQRPTVLLSTPGPYAHVEGLSDEEADEDPRHWGTAALRTTLEQGLQGEAGLDFDEDNRLKRFERRESWLKAHAKLRGGGSILVDTGSLERTNPSYEALRANFRRGRAGGGSILLGGTSAGTGTADGSAAAARRRKFLMGETEPEPQPAATMTMTTVTEAAGAKLTTTTVHEAVGSSDGGAPSLSLVEQMKATDVAPVVHEQGPHVSLADRMREAKRAQAAAKRQRAFLSQGGGAPAGTADGGGVSKMVHRARALSVRESRIAMLGVQLELEETVDVLIDQNQSALEEVAERDKKIELLEKLLADGSRSVSEKLKLLSEYNAAMVDREEAEEQAELSQAAK